MSLEKLGLLPQATYLESGRPGIYTIESGSRCCSFTFVQNYLNYCTLYWLLSFFEDISEEGTESTWFQNINDPLMY